MTDVKLFVLTGFCPSVLDSLTNRHKEITAPDRKQQTINEVTRRFRHHPNNMFDHNGGYIPYFAMIAISNEIDLMSMFNKLFVIGLYIFWFYLINSINCGLFKTGNGRNMVLHGTMRVNSGIRSGTYF